MKKGVIGIIILLILGVVAVGGIGAGYYAYNIYVYKTLRICLGADIDTGYPCNSTQQCFDLVEKYSNETRSIKDFLEEAPEFIREKFEEVINNGIRCEKNCLVKDIRGINKETHEFEFLESCNADEKEVTLEIRGREGLEIYNFLKEQKS